MAYKIGTPQFFTHTIKNLPEGPDGEPQSMQVRYRVVPDEEAAVNLGDQDATTAFVKACVAGIEDLVAEDGTPIPCTPDLLGQLCEAAHLRLALARGYGFGLAKACTGN